MKRVSLFILIALFVSLLPTPDPSGLQTCDTGRVSIFTLDVCGEHGQSVSSHGDVPSLHECPMEIAGMDAAGFHRASPPSINLPLLAFQEERPPEA